MAGGKKGWLRIALEDFLETNPLSQWILEHFGFFYERLERVFQLIEDTKGVGAIFLIFFIPLTSPIWILYMLTGWDFFLSPMMYVSTLLTPEVTQNEYAKMWGDFWKIGPASDLVDTIGSFTSEPILSLFEEFTPDEIANPRSMVRRFHGLLIALTVAPGAVTAAIEKAGLGQLEEPGRIIQSLYWNFGLGFLGWQTIAPLLSAGMQSILEEHYNEKFRPRRFSASELRDLYALGEISPDEMIRGAARLGWRDQEIAKWIKLAFRNLSESDVWSLYKDGEMSQEEVIRRLRAQGYNPEDIPLLFKLKGNDTLDESAELTLSTARAAFREQLISEAEFRDALTQLNKSPREIDLLIQLETATVEQDIRALTVSQVRSAWEENVLSDDEARHWLRENDFGDVQINILLSTWKLQVEPEFRKLNKGTIVNAYVYAVLNRGQAQTKLQSIGLSPEDASLELDLAEARAPEAFGAAPPKPSKALTPGTLKNMFVSGLIDASELYSRLLDLGYSEVDVDLLVRAAIQEATESPRPPTQAIVEDAYLAGVLDRQRALNMLLSIDFDEETSNIILDTVEGLNPWVFNPSSVQALRLPSTAALVEAVRQGIITDTEYYARMAEIGYTADDAKLYLLIGLNQERRSGKTLTVSNIQQAYDRDFINRAVAMMRLVQLGYSDEDANMLLRFIKSGIEETDVWNAMLAGRLSVENAVEQLFAMGFTEDEIEEAFNTLQSEAEGE